MEMSLDTESCVLFCLVLRSELARGWHCGDKTVDLGVALSRVARWDCSGVSHSTTSFSAMCIGYNNDDAAHLSFIFCTSAEFTCNIHCLQQFSISDLLKAFSTNASFVLLRWQIEPPREYCCQHMLSQHLLGLRKHMDLFVFANCQKTTAMPPFREIPLTTGERRRGSLKLCGDNGTDPTVKLVKCEILVGRSSFFKGLVY